MTENVIENVDYDIARTVEDVLRERIRNLEARAALQSKLLDDHIMLTAWMADNDYSADDVAYAVEKPWKFTAELKSARAEAKKLSGGKSSD